MGETVIREARLEDAAALARLMEVLGYPTTLPAMQARLASISSDSDYRTIAAEVDGQIRGMVGLRCGVQYELDGVHVQVMAIVVDEEYQGKGFGTALMRESEAWARSLGAHRITLTSGNHRQVAHQFYKQLGYDSTGLRFVKKL